MNIPELPIQLVAVTDSSAGNFHQTAELNQILVAEVNLAGGILLQPHPTIFTGEQPG